MTGDGRGPLALGVAVPTHRLRIGGTELAGLARRLVDLGCGALWVNDHLAAFPAGTDHYPYSETGDVTWDPRDPQYEALATCGFLAAAAPRAAIGTSVLILPQR